MKAKGTSVARAVLTVALALVVALALAACGGSTSTTAGLTTTSSPSTSLSATTTLPEETIVTTTPLPAPAVAGTIAFTGGIVDYGIDYDIFVVNTDGTGLKTLAGGPGCQMYPRWSPDGSKIVYHESAPADIDPHQVWVMNADGSGKVQLTKEVWRSLFPAWSPDGTQIVFTHMESDIPVERQAIYVMNADGSGMRNVTSKEGEGVDYWPMWAADGKIYFYRLYYGGKPAAEFSVNPDGSALTQLTELGSLDQFVKYGLSPDATRVALHDRNTDRLAVHPVNGNGAPVGLLDPVAAYVGPLVAQDNPTVDVAWSSDQTVLAIAGFYDCGFTPLYVVKADGTGLSAVPGIDAARDPSWRPE